MLSVVRFSANYTSLCCLSFVSLLTIHPLVLLSVILGLFERVIRNNYLNYTSYPSGAGTHGAGNGLLAVALDDRLLGDKKSYCFFAIR